MYMIIKPIPFNFDMVRAILEDRKTTFRRPINPQPGEKPIPIPGEDYWLASFVGDDERRLIKPPYRPGDILYVGETWSTDIQGEYVYRTNYGTTGQ